MLDDDRPDYFLADDKPRQADNDQSSDGKVIDFGSDSETTQGGNELQQQPAHRHRARTALIWTAVVGFLVLAVAFYLRYCSPYAEDAAMKVYVVNVEKRGLFFKTYEAQVVAADALADTTQVYPHPDHFTVSTEKLAREMQQFQGKRQPVTLRYEKFYATLPWRGSSKWVVTSIE